MSGDIAVGLSGALWMLSAFSRIAAQARASTGGAFDVKAAGLISSPLRRSARTRSVVMVVGSGGSRLPAGHVAMTSELSRWSSVKYLADCSAG